MCRLMMSLDLLNEGKIITYRGEHELMMSIRNGEFLTESQLPHPFTSVNRMGLAETMGNITPRNRSVY